MKKKLLTIINIMLIIYCSAFAEKYNPGHWLALQRGAGNNKLNEVTRPGIIGIQKRYSWKSLEPTMNNYDFSKIQADLNYVKARGGHLLVFIEDKSFNNEVITPNYLPVGTYTLEFYSHTAENHGYISKRWDPYVVNRMNALTAAMAAQFDGQDNFEGICFQETAIGISEADEVTYGYSAPLYRDALIDMLTSAKSSFQQSQVLWYFNFLEDGMAMIGTIGDTVAPLGVKLGGPDILPNSYPLKNLVYPFYDEFLPKGYKMFCSAQFDSFSHPHQGGGHSTTYWTPQEIFEFGRDELRIKYLFWNYKNYTSPAGSYSIFDAYPVIEANPTFNVDAGFPYSNDFSASGGVAPDFNGQSTTDINGWTISNGKLKPTAQWRTIYLDIPGAATLTDYTVDVDLKTITPGASNYQAAAALVRYQDDTHYYLVVIEKNGLLKIQKRDGSTWTVLGTSPGNDFTPVAGTNFNFKIVVAGAETTQIDVYVNDAATPSATGVDSSTPYTQGPVAFESRGLTAIEIDNLSVTLPISYENDFSTSFQSDFATDGGQISDWNINGGKLQRNGSWKRIYLTASDAANWDDYTVDVDYQNITAGAYATYVGMVQFRYSAGNYYAVSVDKNGNLKLGKKLNGTWTHSLASKSGFSWNGAHHLKIEVEGENIKVFANGNSTPDIDYTDVGTSLITGGIGFEVRNNHTTFDNLVVSNSNVPSAPPPNQAPVLTTIAGTSVNEGGSLNLNFSASDSDGDPITLTATGIPSFGALSDNGDGTGSISFSPSYSSSGSYTITVSASDGNGGSDSDSFTLIVNNVNQAPVLDPLNDVTLPESDTATVAISSSDPDLDSITLSASGMPPFGTLTDNGDGSGSISFTPGYADSGVYSINIFAEDDNNSSDTTSFTVTVNNANRAPTIRSIANQNVEEDCIHYISISASDDDTDDTLSLSLTGNPAFVSLIDNGDGTGVISLQPLTNNAGIYTIIVTADDGNTNNNIGNISFTLTVDAPSSNYIAYSNNFSSGVTADDFTGGTASFVIAGGEISTVSSEAWRSIKLKEAHFPTTGDNFKIVSKMKRGTGSDWNGCALRFRDVDENNWYELQVKTNGGNDIGLFGKEAGANVTLAEWDTDLDATAYNVFSLVVSGSNVNAYLGNNYLGSATVNLLSGGISLRQRKNDAWWDYFRVVSSDVPDYAEAFDDNTANGWTFDANKFELMDTGGGNIALKQISGSWSFATYSEVVSVDSNYSLSIDGRTTGVRNKNYDSPVMALKYQDGSNWICIYIDQNTSSGARKLVLKKKIEGVVTTRTLASSITALNSVTDWHTIDAKVNSGLLSVWVNATPVITDYVEQDLNAAVFGANTQCGIRVHSAGVGVEVDNVKFYDEYSQ